MAVTHGNAAIVYFDEEGRGNLLSVLRVLQRRLKKYPDLRSLKLVIFTAYGEGPARAYNMLQEFEPEIIAVTCPPDFVVKRGDELVRPMIEPKLRRFFDGVGIKVLTGRWAFDRIEGMDSYNREMKLIRDSLSLFGGGIVPCVQAVLQACDMGAVEIGEQVIAMSGDWAVLMTASSTTAMFTKERGVAINEVFCKPRRFTICRQEPEPELADDSGQKTIEGQISNRPQLSESH